MAKYTKCLLHVDIKTAVFKGFGYEEHYELHMEGIPQECILKCGDKGNNSVSKHLSKSFAFG